MMTHKLKIIVTSSNILDAKATQVLVLLGVQYYYI